MEEELRFGRHAEQTRDGNLRTKISQPNIMQCCEMFSVLVLGYTVCFKLTGPRK